MDLWTLLRFAGGLALLVAGAELLVKGAARLAPAAGISPLVIGLTVVAFGTSSPEMAVSVRSALAGNADLALGNVVGSNTFNVLFILGLSALIVPLRVAAQLVRVDVPIMIAVSLLLLVLAADGRVGRGDGLVLVAGLAAYTAFAVRLGRRDRSTAPGGAAPPTSPGGLVLQLACVAAGLGLLVVGAGWLVASAVTFAKALGMSDLVVGLTIVAAGTSLPEVATSVTASLRGQRDIAVGNVVGSNLFNLLGVLGIAAAAAPGGVPVLPTAEHVDIPIMIAVAAACLPIFFTGHRIARWEGGVFLACYAAYTTYLVLAAQRSPVLPWFNGAMILFVLPLLALTLGVFVAREVRERRGRQP